MPKYKLKYDRIGKSAKCDNCGEDKLWFVITVSDMTFCSECEEHYDWDYLVTKVAITRGGGVNGSQKKGALQKDNRSVEQWEESLQAISKYKQESEDW